MELIDPSPLRAVPWEGMVLQEREVYKTEVRCCGVLWQRVCLVLWKKGLGAEAKFDYNSWLVIVFQN